MHLPQRTDLPFFAYGLFMPGQLGFLRIRPFVQRVESDAKVTGDLLERDGLPILHIPGARTIPGVLIEFTRALELGAYESIAAIEPDKQYRWGIIEVTLSAHTRSANVLLGRNPQKGTAPLESTSWDGRADPLFTAALEVVRETTAANRQFSWDLKPLFRLEMAYLLLWSAIERYASLRYHLGDDVVGKIERIAGEQAFAAAIRDVISEPRTVQRADEPADRATLDPEQPKKSLLYFYQIRSNIVHRGKTVSKDHDRLLSALDQLLPVFERTLAAAFGDAGSA